ncbi:MAG: methyltransferase domain-containing protein, partial [Candidatus Omnitrophica bacterium]|nr:methyltransferase domain-containing protein [Candidatus Omnitrophota bacterium]
MAIIPESTDTPDAMPCSCRCVHLGPGPLWQKPDNQWVTVDADVRYADFCIDLNKNPGLPFATGALDFIYASHFLEHISIFSLSPLLSECFRILKQPGVFRIVLPDVIKSIGEFIRGNTDFSLFRRRKQRRPDLTLFECLREDFISASLQKDVFGEMALAH